MDTTEHPDFDNLVTISERSHHVANIASNDAFILAMRNAVLKKKEKAIPGTFKDTSPMTPASIRMGRADLLHSPVGSPAAMCVGN
jgi:hypothetical protein